MAWRRFQISRTLGGVDNEEAKPEAGSVVAKLDKPEDKQFPKPKKQGAQLGLFVRKDNILW